MNTDIEIKVKIEEMKRRLSEDERVQVFNLLFVFYAFIVILFHAPRIRIRVTQKWEGICIRIMVVAVFLINWTYLIIF